MPLNDQSITLPELCRRLRTSHGLDATTVEVIGHMTRRHTRRAPLWRTRRMVPTGLVEVIAAELAAVEADNRRKRYGRPRLLAVSVLDEELAGVE